MGPETQMSTHLFDPFGFRLVCRVSVAVVILVALLRVR